MEQGQIPPQEEAPPAEQQQSPPAPAAWPTWQQQPHAQQGWGQTPYGYAPLPPPGYAPVPPAGYAPAPYGYGPPPGYAAPPHVPVPGPWPQGQFHPAQLKAPPDEHPEELPWQLAGWWSRVGAQLLDLLIVWLPLGLLLTVPIVLASEAHDGSGTETTWLVVTIVLTFVAIGVHLFYAPLLMKRSGRSNGQTWGKQMCGIRVIRADGKPMRFSDAAMRQIVFKSFGGIVASTFVPLFPWILNYLWPTWDEQHRALHDIAADTRVVAA